MNQGTVLLAVGLGGALGTVVRHQLVGGAGPVTGFPWAVLAVNVAGSFLLGLVVTLVLERWPPTRYVRSFVGIGFCGGLTTFSSWMVDTALLFKDGNAATAVSYVIMTLAVGLAAMYTGVVMARARPPRGATS